MPDVKECLAGDRCVFLAAINKPEAIEELIGHLCRSVPELPYRLILEAVMAREKQLSTRISPYLSIPHATLDDLNRTYIAVGRSLPGIPWDEAKEDEPVPLVFLVVGDKSNHLEVLRALALLLEKREVITNLLAARDSRELYRALVFPQENESGAPVINATSQALLRTSILLSENLDADSILVHLSPERLPEQLIRSSGKAKIIFIVDDNYPTALKEYPVLSLPFKGKDYSGSLELSLLLALAQGLIKKNDIVISLFGRPDSREIDTLSVTEMSKDFDHFLNIPVFGQDGDIELQVFIRLLEIARQLAWEGREGKPVGTLFVLGDHKNVSRYCQQMLVNPFKGYNESERNLLDPSLAETLKEFSRIDGAIVIRGDGVIVSAGTYLRPDKPAANLPPGLGARHAAAAGITAVSNAVSIAISESTRRISIFHAGERIMIL